MRECGIYRFYNTINGKSYIGQSNNLRHRYTQHIKLLNDNADPCPILNRAWNKYGESCFKYEVLEICNRDMLDDKEKYYIQIYDSFNNGYNCNLGGHGNSGFRHSDETKIKIGLASKGKINSEETRRKISEHQIGIPLSESHKQALREAWTPERKEKFIESRTGDKNPNYGKCGKDACNRRAVKASTGEVFDTIIDAARWCGLKSYGNISSCCGGARPYCGRHPATGEKLSWEYI